MQSPEDYRQTPTQIGAYGPATFHLVIGPQNSSHELNKGLQAAPAGMYAPSTAAMPVAGPHQPPATSLVQPQQINHRPIMMNNIQGRPTSQMANLRTPMGNVSQAPPQGGQQYSHVQNVMLQSQVHPGLHGAQMSTAPAPLLMSHQLYFPHRAMQYHHHQQQQQQHQHPYYVTAPYPYAQPSNNAYYPMQTMPSCPAPVNNIPEAPPVKSSQKKIITIINPHTGANVLEEVLSQNERHNTSRTSGSEAAVIFATQVAAAAASTGSGGVGLKGELVELQTAGAQRQSVHPVEVDRESGGCEISTSEICDQYEEDMNSLDETCLSFSDKDSIEINSISENIPIMPDLEQNVEVLQNSDAVTTHVVNNEDLEPAELSPEYTTAVSEFPDEELPKIEDIEPEIVQELESTNCNVPDNELQNFVEESASPVQSDEVLSVSPPSEASLSNKSSEESISLSNALKMEKLPPEGRKSKGKKKKDINRKGDSKEGSEMDAFISQDSAPTCESLPAAVVVQPLPSPPTLSPQHTSTSLPPAPVAVIDDVPIETIVDRSLLNSIPLPDEVESPEEPVQAPSPEISTEEKKEDSETSLQETAKVVLKYSYKEDQWSPLNPEGKKHYDREFLLKLQQQPMSMKKPTNLPNLDVIKDKAHVHKLNDSIARIQQGGSMLGSMQPRMNPGFDPFVPPYVRPTQKQMHPGMRRSQQGRDNKPTKKVIFSSSLNQSVKLHESENAWKAGGTGVLELTVDVAAAADEELYKKVRGILNKLTPQKFDKLVVQVKGLDINTEERLKGVIDLVFEKAIDEPNFSVPYASMCKQLAMTKVPRADKEGECVNFRKLLLTKCQKEFEKDQSDEILRAEKMKQIEECNTEDKKKLLQDDIEVEERKNRRRQLGNIRFIGELFKLGMLTEPIMHDCIKKLLSQSDEDSLECLCRLLTTIGKELEAKKEKESNDDFQDKKEKINSYFAEMRKIVDMRITSSRVRFMLQDVIDLKKCNWVPRRDDNNPKTIDQIHQEAEREAQEQQLALHNMQFLPKRPPEDNRKNNSNKGRETDGWTVSSRTGKTAAFSSNLDPSKLKAFSRPELDNIQLGPAGRGFMSWGRGSSGGYKQTNEQENKQSTLVSNRYTALADQGMSNMEARRSSQRSAASSRESSKGRNNPMSPMIRKTPSASKERELAIEATMQLARSSQPEQKVQEYTKVPDIVKNINGKGALANPNALKGGELSREEIEKKTKPLMDEFLHTGDFEEATNCILELASVNTVHIFISEAINQVLERSSQARCSFGQLLQKLVKDKTLTMEQYNKGLWSVLEVVDDYALDIPKIWEYLGEVIQPMIDGNSETLRCMVETLRPCIPSLSAAKVMAAILHSAAKTRGEIKISEMWKDSGLKWSSFMPPEEDISKFMSTEKLEFIDSPKKRIPAELSPAEIKKHLDVFLEANFNMEIIFDWIDGHVAPTQVKESGFVRALITAICENAITGSGDACELSSDKLKSWMPLLTRYVADELDLQLPVLYAVQALITRLDQPKGILRGIFDLLYDDDIIHEDVYKKWEESDDPAEQEGKGVAKSSVQGFFVWLREPDVEPDGESEEG